MGFRKMMVSSEVRVQERRLTPPSVLPSMFLELASQPICLGVLEHIQYAYSFILNNLWLAERDTKSDGPFPWRIPCFLVEKEICDYKYTQLS